MRNDLNNCGTSVPSSSHHHHCDILSWHNVKIILLTCSDWRRRYSVEVGNWNIASGRSHAIIQLLLCGDFFVAFSLIMPCFCKTFYIEMILILYLSHAIFLMCDVSLLDTFLSQFWQNHIKSLLYWFLLKCLITPSPRTLQNSENSWWPRHGAKSAGKTGQNSALPPRQRDQTRAGNNSEK